MPHLKIENFHLSYGEQIIFDNVNLQLDAGERLCIVGRNGAGKSTMLKCLEGKVQPDSGSRWIDPALKITSLDQELPERSDLRIDDFVAQGAGEVVNQLKRYDDLVAKASHSDAELGEMERLLHDIDVADGWTLSNRVEQILHKLELNADSLLSELSGGWRRRAALAQALVKSPDILLLDEPTNHLDIGAIQWLEGFLNTFAGAIVFITHDRAFLRKVANRIVELDRGNLLAWNGNYDGFLAFKEQKLAEEERENALFDKKLAQEETWIRQGIKARRTRNEGRVRALKAMREERAQRRERLGTVTLEHSRDSVSGKIVAELDNVSFAWEDRVLVKNFSSTILRGDKIGLIGPNGVGKTTLLKLFLGELAPQEGHVKLGTKLSVAYFDQMRDQLDLEKSAIDNIAEGSDTVTINGKDKHVISYLNDFMFSGERARTAIKSLSGGERNRILLAKLFSKPSNLLVMDEPTNDLDAETLELLEELLANYDGTLLLVSHDREFMDNVITSTIAFEDFGVVREYIGGYHDWIRQGGKWFSPESNISNSQPVSESEVDNSPSQVTPPAAETEKKSSVKLSYKLQRELDELPAKLEKLETEIGEYEKQIADPDFYNQESRVVNQVLDALSKRQSELDSAFERWESLEEMKNA